MSNTFIDWHRENECKKSQIDFINLEFLIDEREVQKKYKEEYLKNVDGIKDSNLSFYDWINYKKYLAAKFYVEGSDFNI